MIWWNPWPDELSRRRWPLWILLGAWGAVTLFAVLHRGGWI
jgi:hypothetical protein